MFRGRHGKILAFYLLLLLHSWALSDSRGTVRDGDPHQTLIRRRQQSVPLLTLRPPEGVDPFAAGSYQEALKRREVPTLAVPPEGWGTAPANQDRGTCGPLAHHRPPLLPPDAEPSSRRRGGRRPTLGDPIRLGSDR